MQKMFVIMEIKVVWSGDRPSITTTSTTITQLPLQSQLVCLANIIGNVCATRFIELVFAPQLPIIIIQTVRLSLIR